MKKRYLLMIVAALLLGFTAIGGTMAALDTQTSESAVAGISVKNISVTTAGTKEGELVINEEGKVSPGGELACPLWVENNGDGYDIYVKVELFKNWDADDLDAAKSTVVRNADDENWLVWYEDDEQLTLYYRYPLKATKEGDEYKTTNFMEGISFSTEMNNRYADAKMVIDYTVTAVQANNSEAAIAAEWGVFPVFDENGTLIDVFETRAEADAARVTPGN